MEQTRDRSGSPPAKKTRPGRAAFLIPAALLFLALASIRLQWPELSHGDEWSDASVPIAGENFARLGFVKTHGLPIFRPGSPDAPPAVRPDSPGWTELSVFGTYTRLPALYHWINGVLYPLFGDGLIFYRFIALAVSGVAVVAFYLLVVTLSGSPRMAGIAAALYVANPYFLANFDSIHQHAYMDALRNLGLLALARLAGASPGKRWPLWAGAWVVFFLSSLTAYEYLPWLCLGTAGLAGYFFLRREPKAGVAAALLMTAFAAGILLHFGLVAAHYGSVQEALADRMSNAMQRMGGQKGHENLLGTAGAFSWGAWWRVVALRFPAQVSVVGWGGLLASVFFGVSVAISLPGGRSRVPLVGLAAAAFFFVGGSAWYCLMPAHCVDHAALSFLQKFLVPGICLFLAASTEGVAQLLDGSSVKPAFRTALVALFPACIAAAGIWGSEIPLSAEKRFQEQEFAKIKSSLLRLRPEIGRDGFLACNLMRPTWMMMFYTRARTVTIADVKTFDAYAEKPDFFLFVPLNTPDASELGKVLGSYYRVDAISDNKRLPFYVLRRL
jgi:hypothetical protein